ncbi:MAG: DUF2793 domain-containing protein [Gammaproteobacteria bacterium]
MVTPNLDLPEIAENQALKYLTHNEALRQLDALVPGVVQDKDLTRPPVHTPGAMYVVAANAFGDWQGQDNNLAYSRNNAWVFIIPQKDWRVFISDEQSDYRFDGQAWMREVIGDVQAPAVVVPNAWLKLIDDGTKQLHSSRWLEASSGEVLAGGDLDLQGQLLQNPRLQYRVHDLGDLSGTVILDFKRANKFQGVLTEDVTFEFSNLPQTDEYMAVQLFLQQDAQESHNLTWPQDVYFANGVPPSYSRNPLAIDIIQIIAVGGRIMIYPQALNFLRMD